MFRCTLGMVGDSFFQPRIKSFISNGNLPSAIAVSTSTLPSPEILNKFTHEYYRINLTKKE
ncbi:hypothetical protein [Nostoc sp.]